MKSSAIFSRYNWVTKPSTVPFFLDICTIYVNCADTYKPPGPLLIFCPHPISFLTLSFGNITWTITSNKFGKPRSLLLIFGGGGLRASSPIWAPEWNESRENARASGEAARGRESSPFLDPSLARSREARFACPNRRACSQAMGEETYPSGFLQGNTVLFLESLIGDLHIWCWRS